MTGDRPNPRRRPRAGGSRPRSRRPERPEPPVTEPAEVTDTDAALETNDATVERDADAKVDAADVDAPALDDTPAEMAPADTPPADTAPAPAPAADEPVPATDQPAEASAAPEPAPDPKAVDSKAVGKRRRPSVRASVVGAFLCGALGFALAAQLQNNDGDSQFANARQSDLVQILDELNSREERLRGEIADLEFRRESINSRAQGSEAALSDARRRATELGILAGTIPAEGPGLLVTLTDGSEERLPASTILDTVEELRGAGAEAMQIKGSGDRTVRIGVSTYFADVDNGIEVDGQKLTGPYRISVIGDPATMAGALKIAGGIVESVHKDGGDAVLAESRTVQVTAVRPAREPKFAKPAS
jgi:uncharacterized protein YlxW (UPF0749 family)